MQSFRSIIFKDHPRVCGKDAWHSLWRVYLMGSPPRVREGQQLISLMIVKKRITPACAGRTKCDSSLCNFRLDHPRVCGKDRIKSYLSNAPEGSPPRVREGLQKIKAISTLTRITPACAGRTKYIYIKIY